MTNRRRQFLQNLLALGVLPGLARPSAMGPGPGVFFDEDDAQAANPDFDRQAYGFWSGFLDNAGEPVVSATGQHRGGGKAPSGAGDLRPIFLHYGAEGFKNAVELDTTGLISEGDVSVSLNTSTLKVAPQDQEMFERVQNAQVRVDIHQKTPLLPVIEAMSYTVVSGMLSLKAAAQSKSSGVSSGGRGAKGSTAPSGSKGSAGSIQSINIETDAAWQKMQNIILPGGEGRWALNLEAQKKDSLLCKVLQFLVKETGQFAPLISLPGIALSALQSFNTLYGAIHALPVRIIETAPLRVFATQEAVQRTGAPGAVTGILLRSGTYVLIPANRAAKLQMLEGLTVVQGRIVPPKTNVSQLDAAALDTLRDVTYVTFDVGVSPTRVLSGTGRRTS
jgi:hypothetical protein